MAHSVREIARAYMAAEEGCKISSLQILRVFRPSPVPGHLSCLRPLADHLPGLQDCPNRNVIQET